jgi:cytochrome c oxidase subunit 3
MLAIGVMIWLGSEVMFFSGLFAALFTIRAHLQKWPPDLLIRTGFKVGGHYEVTLGHRVLVGYHLVYRSILVPAHLDVLQAGVFTFLLVSSSFTMQRAVWQQEHDRRVSAKRWLWATFVLGALFLSNQFYEWTHLQTRWNTNSYGSIFFITTGLHGLHVFLGLVAMTFLAVRMKGREHGDPGELSNFQAVSYYWHFVDIVWVGLYSCLFLLK